MAVLGLQLVFSMVSASLLSKISSRHSFARWLLCSQLVRYLYPSDEELRKLAGVPPPSNKHKPRHKGDNKNDAFTVPKSLNIPLESTRVAENDVLPLNFYTEFQWLLDFTVCCLVVYLLTESYYFLLEPKGEFNLSMLWCLLVIGFSIKILFSLTAIYFATEESGERIMCFMFGFFFLVFAMGILIVNEDTLEFGLESAYYNFSMEARTFLENQGMESAGPTSFLVFRIILAIISAILGAMLTFPGLRLAKMHTDSLKYASERPVYQVLLHMNIVLPLVLSLLWLKPITRDFLISKRFGDRPLLSNEQFDIIRIGMVLAFCLFRFLLIWTHLQAHLNLAWDKVEKLKKEAGRIKAVDLQKMIIRVFYYLCVVALQYLAPIILLLATTLMLKTMGNYSVLESVGVVSASESGGDDNISPMTSTDTEGITATAAQFSLALSSLKQVFTPVCYRAVLSFLTWWICTAWFTTSAFGLVYYSYFESVLS